MRQVNRLSQYQRLYQQLGSVKTAITVNSVADILCCSERHARTLLQSLQQQGWVSWHSQAGRGKRAWLQCLKQPNELRAASIQTLLQQGDHQNALAMAQLGSQHLQDLLTPHMGGQWQADSPTLRIPYYRPLEPLDPLTLSGRAEKHLVTALHAGLTRFVAGDPQPKADLAHHWQVSDDGLSWHFFLRGQLRWHNGETLAAQQILTQLQRLCQHPSSQPYLAAIRHISLPHALCLRIDLHQPDYWLAHRLAELSCLITHPNDINIGAGPYKLVEQSPKLVRLEQHGYYHLQHPYLEYIEYWITPELFSPNPAKSGLHPVSITIGQQQDLPQAQPVQRRIGMGFCYLALNMRRQTLSPAQAQKLMTLVQQSGLLADLPIQRGIISLSSEMLPGWPIPDFNYQDDIALPTQLTLIYHLPNELEAVSQALKQVLAQAGCQLTILFYAGKRWQDQQQLTQADLILGDRLIGESPEVTLEGWLRQDPLWPAILPPAQRQQQLATLTGIQQLPTEALRHQQLRQLYLALMGDALILPLFRYHYQISAPPNIHNVVITAYGWFDFCQAWLPPPLP